jgi:hypothetical protein
LSTLVYRASASPHYRRIRNRPWDFDVNPDIASYGKCGALSKHQSYSTSGPITSGSNASLFDAAPEVFCSKSASQASVVWWKERTFRVKNGT